MPYLWFFHSSGVLHTYTHKPFCVALPYIFIFSPSPAMLFRLILTSNTIQATSFFPSVTWSSLMLVLLFPDRLVSSHRIYGGFLHWYLHSNQIECINMKIWLDCVWRSSVDAHEKLLIQNKSIRSVFLMQTYNAIFGEATSSNNNEHCTAQITHITTTYAGLEEDRTIDNVQKIAHKPHKHTNTHEQCEFSQTIFHILTCISCTISIRTAAHITIPFHYQAILGDVTMPHRQHEWRVRGRVCVCVCVSMYGKRKAKPKMPARLNNIGQNEKSKQQQSSSYDLTTK